MSIPTQTDDLRESPALAVIDELLLAGADVVAHDPIAVPAARAHYEDRGGVQPQFVTSSYDAVREATRS